MKQRDAVCDEILSVRGKVHKRCQSKYEKHGLDVFIKPLDDSIEWSYLNASKHIKHGDTIIDIGCCYAENISKIKRYMDMNDKTIYTIGIDFSNVEIKQLRNYLTEEQVKLVAKHHGNLDKFIKGDFTKVDIKNKADIVICFGLGNWLGHTKPERQASYNHMLGFLKPDGNVIFDVYYKSSELINRSLKMMNKNEFNLHIEECVGNTKYMFWFLEGTDCNHGKEIACRDMMIDIHLPSERFL